MGDRLLSFFFQAEDGIRDPLVTGVQTCALPICASPVLCAGNRAAQEGCGRVRAAVGATHPTTPPGRAGGVAHFDLFSRSCYEPAGGHGPLRRQALGTGAGPSAAPARRSPRARARVTRGATALHARRALAGWTAGGFIPGSPAGCGTFGEVPVRAESDSRQVRAC